MQGTEISDSNLALLHGMHAVQIDKCFGFDTAVEEAQTALLAAKVEASSADQGIGLVKLMGRSSGFIAMQASMASGLHQIPATSATVCPIFGLTCCNWCYSLSHLWIPFCHQCYSLSTGLFAKNSPCKPAWHQV